MAVVAIPNGSFEFGGSTTGTANGWTKTSSVDDMLFAGFDEATLTQLGSERFESWGGVLSDLDSAVAALFGGTDEEDFETGWQNDLFFFELEPAIVASALFDVTIPEPVEDFEEEWQNDNFHFDFSTVTSSPAMFDPSVPEPFEDFEEEWNNDSYHFDWTTVTPDTALFDAGTNPAEDFEGTWALMLDL